MNNKKVLLILILVFVIVLGGAYTMYIKLGDSLGAEQLAVQEAQTPNEDKSEDTDDAGAENIAPDFIVYDIDGNEVRLHDYLGKPIVLNFWASWCGPCQMEMPDFDEKYMEIGEEVQFLMINMTDGQRETVESAAAFISEKGYSFPVFYDKNAEAAMAYAAYALPTTYFIDKAGNALARASGAIDADTLQRGIDLIK